MATEFVRYSPRSRRSIRTSTSCWRRSSSSGRRRSPSRRRPRAPDVPSAARTPRRWASSKAEVEILADVPAPYAQGIFATPGRHGALIRFSSASNHLGPDAQLGPVLGFAIKIFDIEGAKLIDDEPDTTTFDLVLKNSPIFIANTAKHYMFIQELGNDSAQYLARGKAGLPRASGGAPHRQGHARSAGLGVGRDVRVRQGRAQTPVSNPLLTPYWSMGAMRHGDYVAKVRVAPTADSAGQAIHPKLDLTSGPDVFGPALAEELQGAGVRLRSPGSALHRPRDDAGRRGHGRVARERCRRSSPSRGCISRNRTSRDLTTRRRATRWRSTNGASPTSTGRWARSCTCGASTPRRPRSAGRSTTSRRLSQPAPPRSCLEGPGSQTMLSFVAIGLDHTTAGIELRERVAFPEAEIPAALRRLTEPSDALLDQAAIVSTCNRVELYGVARSPPADGALVSFVAERNGLDASDVASKLYIYRDEHVAHRLAETAAGLHSLVLGEAQIQGQIRVALEHALAVGTVGPELRRLFESAIAAGRRVRSQTAIGRGTAGIPQATVELACRRVDDLSTSTVLVIGAGAIGELAVRQLCKRGVGELVVLGRTRSRAQRLAASHRGRAIAADGLDEALERSDVVITATGAPGPVLGPDRLRRAVARRARTRRHSC